MGKRSFGIIAAASLALAIGSLPASAMDDVAADGAVGLTDAVGKTTFHENGKTLIAYGGWSCEARSTVGSWGIGEGPTRSAAASIAMSYCRVNTPYGYYCFITGCSPN